MKFEPNRPVETREPRVVVDPGLRPGRYRFQLVVIGASGQRSTPIEVIVTVERT